MLVSNAAPAAPLDAARPADPRPVEALIDAISLRLGKVRAAERAPHSFPQRCSAEALMQHRAAG